MKISVGLCQSAERAFYDRRLLLQGFIRNDEARYKIDVIVANGSEQIQFISIAATNTVGGERTVMWTGPET